MTTINKLRPDGPLGLNAGLTKTKINSVLIITVEPGPFAAVVWWEGGIAWQTMNAKKTVEPGLPKGS